MTVKYGYKYAMFIEHGFKKHIFTIYQISEFGFTNRFAVKFQSGGDFPSPYGGTISDLNLEDFGFVRKFLGNEQFYFSNFRKWMRHLKKRKAVRLVYDNENYNLIIPELIKRNSK